MDAAEEAVPPELVEVTFGEGPLGIGFQGVEIGSLVEGSAAASAGCLRVGAVLVSAAGRSVEAMPDEEVMGLLQRSARPLALVFRLPSEPAPAPAQRGNSGSMDDGSGPKKGGGAKNRPRVRTKGGRLRLRQRARVTTGIPATEAEAEAAAEPEPEPKPEPEPEADASSSDEDEEEGEELGGGSTTTDSDSDSDGEDPVAFLVARRPAAAEPEPEPEPEELARVLSDEVAARVSSATDPEELAVPAATDTAERKRARAAPVWIPDAEATHCMLCGVAEFWRAGPASWTRHHCRSCGWVVCASCRPSKQTLEMDRWVSSTSGHEIKQGSSGVGQAGRLLKPKKVCNSCFTHAPAEIKQRQAAWNLEASAVNMPSEPEPEPEPETDASSSDDSDGEDPVAFLSQRRGDEESSQPEPEPAPLEDDWQLLPSMGDIAMITVAPTKWRPPASPAQCESQLQVAQLRLMLAFLFNERLTEHCPLLLEGGIMVETIATCLSTSNSASLKVSIGGIRSTVGAVRLAIWSSAAGWQQDGGTKTDHAAIHERYELSHDPPQLWQLRAGGLRVTVPDLQLKDEAGDVEYAAIAIHDLKDQGKLDTNFVGKPPRYRCHLGCILLKAAAVLLRAGMPKDGICCSNGARGGPTGGPKFEAAKFVLPLGHPGELQLDMMYLKGATKAERAAAV